MVDLSVRCIPRGVFTIVRDPINALRNVLVRGCGPVDSFVLPCYVQLVAVKKTQSPLAGVSNFTVFSEPSVHLPVRHRAVQ